jgi:hypothetical protein
MDAFGIRPNGMGAVVLTDGKEHKIPVGRTLSSRSDAWRLQMEGR